MEEEEGEQIDTSTKPKIGQKRKREPSDSEDWKESDSPVDDEQEDQEMSLA